MISSPRKFNKFHKSLTDYQAAKWLADEHTYISDKKIQVKQRAKRLENSIGDWDLKLITFNKEFIEWVVTTGDNELAKKVAIVASDSYFEPITKDHRIDWRLKSNYADMDWAAKTNAMLEV